VAFLFARDGIEALQSVETNPQHAPDGRPIAITETAGRGRQKGDCYRFRLRRHQQYGRHAERRMPKRGMRKTPRRGAKTCGDSLVPSIRR
jgi:hypothetical protein